MFKKLGAEMILTGMIAPWMIWATVAVFESQKADAVIDNKFENIIEMLKEIKEDVKVIKAK